MADSTRELKMLSKVLKANVLLQDQTSAQRPPPYSTLFGHLMSCANFTASQTNAAGTITKNMYSETDVPPACYHCIEMSRTEYNESK